MKLSRFAALAMAGLLVSTPVLAQTPVQISADTFTVEEGSQQAVFTGNVVVKHPTVNVWADKVVATYGEGGTSDIKTFEATGTVKLETDEQTATGERAVFTPADQLLRLTGNVKVTNSGGTVNAQELVVNLKTNVSTFTAGQGGRVTGVFTSQ
jgi:lipopolysaccharide export system protein LptA